MQRREGAAGEAEARTVEPPVTGLLKQAIREAVSRAQRARRIKRAAASARQVELQRLKRKAMVLDPAAGV
jgi:hypothetical protein